MQVECEVFRGTSPKCVYEQRRLFLACAEHEYEFLMGTSVDTGSRTHVEFTDHGGPPIMEDHPPPIMMVHDGLRTTCMSNRTTAGCSTHQHEQ